MTLDEIVNEVHGHLEPIRAQCDVFCGKVEEYAATLEKYTREALDRHRAEFEKRQKERERLGVRALPDETLIPGPDGSWFFQPSPSDRERKAGPPHEGWVWTQFCDYSYTGLQEMDVFWRPSEPQPPVGWFLLLTSDCDIVPVRTTRPWSNEERLVCECFRLAAAHDYRLIYTSSPHEKVFLGTAYSGRFPRDDLARALWEQMKGSPRGLEDLQLSWDWSKAKLEEHVQRQAGGIPGSAETAPPVKSQPTTGGVDEMEIGQIRKYADRVAELLEPMEVPPLERTWESEPHAPDGTSGDAGRIAAELNRVLHPFRVEYRKRVVAILGDDWEPIVDLVEQHYPQALGRLEGWRQDVLNHTDPGAASHRYWLESCDEGHKKYGPNSDLKNRLENLVGKLRRSADSMEKALTGSRRASGSELDQQLTQLDLPGLIELLITLKQADESNDERLREEMFERLQQRARSPEDLWAFFDGPRDKYGASPAMKDAIDLVKGARKSWGGPGFYPALWERLASEDVIAELERWQGREGARPSKGAEGDAGVKSSTLPEYTKAMNAKAAAELLGLGEKTFRAKFNAGEIEGTRAGRKYRIHIREFPAEVLAKLKLNEMTR